MSIFTDKQRTAAEANENLADKHTAIATIYRARAKAVLAGDHLSVRLCAYGLVARHREADDLREAELHAQHLLCEFEVAVRTDEVPT